MNLMREGTGRQTDHREDTCRRIPRAWGDDMNDKPRSIQSVIDELLNGVHAASGGTTHTFNVAAVQRAVLALARHERRRSDSPSGDPLIDEIESIRREQGLDDAPLSNATATVALRQLRRAGATLRDQFAMYAPPYPFDPKIVPGDDPIDVRVANRDARWRYCWADAMLRARGER